VPHIDLAATVLTVSRVDDVLDKFCDQGWTVGMQEPVHRRSPNPTRVALTRGRQERLGLIMYAWAVTGEGKGRRGTDYRIQTTRSHEGALLSEARRLTLCFGVDAAREVIAVFDGWTKRNTGGSSSVHIKRSMLDEAANAGYATYGPPWDARAAARFDQIDKLLPWIHAQTRTRLAAVQAEEHSVSGESAIARADLWDSAPAAWLRPGDRLVLADRTGQHLVDDSIWAVGGLEVTITKLGRYPRRAVTFTCQRYGRVKNEAKVLEGLTRRPVK
jgi:hypothetical protein